jgi:glycosidase
MANSVFDPAVIAARHPTRVTASPEDWRDIWLYFLLLDRFNNPARAPLDPGNPLTYKGGNFAGIVAELPYLKKLGVGAIWLSPILMNPQWFNDFYGGYGIEHFLRVEPRYCSDPAAALADPAVAEAELRGLVDEAHKCGIRVVFDIVLNHAGNLFNYEGAAEEKSWNPYRSYDVYWRDGAGVAQGTWNDGAAVPAPDGVWPQELRANTFFRRRGNYDASDVTKGDFPGGFRELVTEYRDPNDLRRPYPVRDVLIRAYQHLIAAFDIDGYRIDTLMYVERDFARIFGNAMREFALSIGKKNFLTFGEVWMDDDEAAIARFVGRDTRDPGAGNQFVGVDSAIDFPVRKRLTAICKAQMPPAELARWFALRWNVQQTVVSSHADASAYYVTFLDNHDLTERFHWPAMPEQTTQALACLFTLPGLPCVYYGTEQGLSGRGTSREAVRECLWANPSPFDQANPLYVQTQALSALRGGEPALRYGRTYFREVSGNGRDFGYSEVTGGVLAYSRILDDREVVVVANTSTTTPFAGSVTVDASLSPVGRAFGVLHSNLAAPAAPGAVFQVGGRVAVPVQLRPMEVQILG